MRTLGLEISDAGIMVAACDPERLLIIDGEDTESPGFALAKRKRFFLGRAAERKAHLYPREVIDCFWDQLNTQPLEQANPYAQNHAELAYEHLARIWKAIKDHGNEMMIAVPASFNKDHMGLVLGIARELSIPVKGFVPQAVAATPNHEPEGLLLHLDIHLHRAEVTCLKWEDEDRLIQKDSAWDEGRGISRLYKEWINSIAEEFVRVTRFDPLHKAASEQELYDRLPDVLTQLQKSPSVVFEMRVGSKTYHITLTRDLFLQKCEPVFQAINHLINRMLQQHGKNDAGVVFQMTHRLSRLPGFKEMLARRKNRRIIDLEPGSGALGTIRFRDQFPYQPVGQGVPFLNSRHVQYTGKKPIHASTQQPKAEMRPTHLLYRNMAYPITEQILSIGSEKASDGSGIRISGQSTGVSSQHCSIQLSGQDVVLKDYSTHGTFVDENRIAGNTIVKLGQHIRVGTPGETLQLIACLNVDET